MKISGTRIDLENGRIDNAVLKNYGETLVGGVSGATSGTAYTVDISSGNIFHIFMNGNCTFTFSNPTSSGTTCYFTLLLKQDGATRTATWPSTVTWAGGSAPTLSTQGGAHDIVSFMTTDGGSSYVGFIGGQSFPQEPAPVLYNLFGWGRNLNGEVGDGTGVSRSVPTQVGTLSTWAAVTSVSGTLATRTDNTLWAFGTNVQGLLGLGDTVSRSSPTQVGGMINWVTPTSGGYKTGLFIKTDGTLWTWGANNTATGKMGDGTVVDKSSPVQIGTLTTWSSVAGSYVHSVALKTDGTIWVWGSNAKGYLGLGTVVARSSPVQLGTLATWSRIATGATFTAAIKTDGTLWVWGGYNSSYGQLGLGDAIDRSSPVQVGTLTTWSQVNGGGVARHAVALKTDGSLWVWGQNAHGQLGLGDRALSGTYRSSPVQVGTLTNWSRIAASSIHSAAINTSNELWIWGKSSSFGTLGLNDVIGRSSPVQVGGGNGWASVALTVANTLALQDPALLAAGTLWSWGQNALGALGLGDAAYRSSPTQVGVQNMWSDVYQNSGSTLALKSDGTMWSWGNNAANGALGQGDEIPRSSPVQVGPMLPATQSWTSIAMSEGPSAAATRADGSLWVWGHNSKGMLGLGDAYNGPGPDAAFRSSPTQLGTLRTWVPSLSMNGPFRHAIQTNGTLWAWGYNKNGAMAQGDIINRSSPVQIGTLATWAKVAAGRYHALDLATDGTLWSLGYNAPGQLGLGDVVSRSSPVQVGTLTWRTIAASNSTSVGIRSDSTLWIWGRNNYGQLGLGDRGAGNATSRSSPTQVGTLATWAAVAAYNSQTTALKTDGTMWTWGNNASGALAQQDVVLRSSPVQVGTLSTWTRTKGTFRALSIQWTGSASAPSAPRNVVAFPGQVSGTMFVSFTPSVKSGSKPITQYTVTSSPGSVIATGSNNMILVSGLTDGTLYTFTVTATNAVGTSAASTKSNVAKPGSYTLYAWGNNTYGRLGLTDAINRSSPTQVGTLNTWSSILASNGARMSHATRTDGTLWAWGKDTNYYALGLNAILDRSSPTQVGTLTGWSTMTASYASVIALKLDGSMWSWGKGFGGQLGLGTASATNFSSPVQIGTLMTWAKIASGRQHTAAISLDGTLWTWGRGTHGEIGDSTAIFRSSPVQVGTLATWSSVSAGMYTTLAMKTDGSLWVWGYNKEGHLGLSDVAYRSSPTQLGTLNTWASVGSSYHNTFAIDTSGKLWSWGRNAYGNLGLADIVNRSSPTQVGTLSTWTQTTGGAYNSRARKTDGTIWAWGRNSAGNSNGALGLGDVVDRSSPVQVGTLTGWKDISGGAHHSTALR